MDGPVPCTRQLNRPAEFHTSGDALSEEPQDAKPELPPEPARSGIFAPMTLKQQSNRIATPGLVLAILVWPVGLVLSAIALIRSRSRGGMGQTTSILGLVFGVILAVATFAVIGTLKTSPTPKDPGCAAAKTAALSLESYSTDTIQLESDATALQKAVGKASSQQLKATIDAVYSSTQLYIQQLETVTASTDVPIQQLQANLDDLNRICQYPS